MIYLMLAFILVFVWVHTLSIHLHNLFFFIFNQMPLCNLFFFLLFFFFFTGYTPCFILAELAEIVAHSTRYDVDFLIQWLNRNIFSCLLLCYCVSHEAGCKCNLSFSPSCMIVCRRATSYSTEICNWYQLKSRMFILTKQNYHWKLTTPVNPVN